MTSIADIYGQRYLPPLARFSAAPQSGPAPLTVAFTERSTFPTADSRAWDFGDGETSTEENPTHEYLWPGSYTVVFTATWAGRTYTQRQTNLIEVVPLHRTLIDYTYDGLYRLTKADSTGAQPYTFEYAYDAVGNRTTQTATIASPQVTNYVYDEANRLISVDAQPYEWDDNDNLIDDGEKTYIYDQANRLTAIEDGSSSVTYAYNGDGVRLQQIVNEAPTTYALDLAAPLPVVLQSQTDELATRYVYALGTRPLAQYMADAPEYLLADALGSVRQIVDVDGNVILAQSYEPYGTVLTSNGTASSIFAYAGEQVDTSGLVYLRARYLQPMLGLFLAKDPWSGDVWQPGSMIGYSYVENDPINHTDPSGQWALDLSNQKVYLVAEEGDSWDTYLAGFYGNEVTVATLSSWLHVDLRLSPPRTGTKVNITSALDPLIAKTAEFGEGMERENRYYPPNVPPFNCYPTALTCAADECQYYQYTDYDIDDFLRDNSRNIEHETNLRYGDIFRIGGKDGERGDGRPAFYNAPIHYGMILWRSGQTGKIWTFNGQITSYAFIAQLPDVLAYYRTEHPERDIIGVPKPDDYRGDFGPMHPTGFYRLNISVSAAQIVQWIDRPKE